MALLASSAINDGNSLIVATFRSELSHQLLLVVVGLAVWTLAWNLWRASRLRRPAAAAGVGRLDPADPLPIPEPAGRRIIRIGFGILWIVDGLLQAQSAMPVGLGSQVIQPGASGSPGWLQHLVNSGVTIWNNHPVQAASATVWIEIGLGAWLLVAPRGRWSQASAVASIGWGLIVWVFGEALGALLAPGLTVLTGAPGAALLYCLGGGLVALPERAWSRPRIGRAILAGLGAFLIVMAILQAWPGRGYWQGATNGQGAGTLAGKLATSANQSQPSVFASWVSSFRTFDVAHGVLVNLAAVAGLLVLGVALCWARGRTLRSAVWAICILAVADWVLVEDFGVFGGLGTDPNTMIPFILLVVGGYVALERATAPAATARLDQSADVAVDGLPGESTQTVGGSRRSPAATPPVFAAVAAVALILIGAAPLAAAATNPTADPIVTLASNGAPGVVNFPAPGWTLTDQHGRTVTLGDLRGKTVALTFLDPVCTTDCPVIAQEFRLADQALRAAASHTVFIAIVANPLYRDPVSLNTFDHLEGMDHLSNWLFLTGSLDELRPVWNVYGAQVAPYPAGAMVDHANVAYVIDARGHVRYIMSADPGDDTSTTRSSFTGLLDQQIHSVLPTP